MKRTFDTVAAATGLVFLAPVFLAVAAAIKSTSPGPVFYRQERLGLKGSIFRIFKFRSMVQGAAGDGSSVTAGGDRRVTRVGRFLRRHKLDELPQLINVVRGEMALVGPRPEVPRFAKIFPEIYQRILTVRPGITHRASLVFRNEEEILAMADDPDRMYIEQVMPYKLHLYEDGLARQDMVEDVRTIVDTIFHATVAVTVEELERVNGTRAAAVVCCPVSDSTETVGKVRTAV